MSIQVTCLFYALFGVFFVIFNVRFEFFMSVTFQLADIFMFLFLFFQQHTGERKQMAKAIAAVNKTTTKSVSFKKRTPSPATPAQPAKRRSFQSPSSVTCYNCQQPGHIAPRCPSRPAASSTPAVKPAPKK